MCVFAGTGVRGSRENGTATLAASTANDGVMMVVVVVVVHSSQEYVCLRVEIFSLPEIQEESIYIYIPA